MNILFITLIDIKDISERGIYQDLLRQFAANGHNLYILSPSERRYREETRIIKKDGVSILKVKIGNIQKTNIIEKGITTLSIESKFKNAIKKYYKNIKFDAVIYSTPPITFAKVIEYVKKHDNAETYLLLKDIFPQNAVDLGMMKTKGAASFIYKLFRKKEIKLYNISDKIGCMSKANVDYILAHNEIDKAKVHISPNSIEINEEFSLSEEEKNIILNEHNIPPDVKKFIYGGNLGKPQDIPFIIECLKQNQNKKDRFFIICGTGTHYSLLKNYIDSEKPENVILINGLSKDNYEKLASLCDAGLIFLDKRFTIPNFPSRILSYMQLKLPVIACTDKNSDIGKMITDNNFGAFCLSESPDDFTEVIDGFVSKSDEDFKKMGENAYETLKKDYSADKSYKIITSELSN